MSANTPAKTPVKQAGQAAKSTTTSAAPSAAPSVAGDDASRAIEKLETKTKAVYDIRRYCTPILADEV
jgi:hypothetical protein